MSNGEPLNLEPALQRIVSKALADEHYAGVFEAFCDELASAGVPLLRAHLTMHALHPLVSSVDVTWLRGQGLVVTPREYTPADEWLRSPLYWMLSNERWELRQNLRSKDAVREFPVFAEFRNLGARQNLYAERVIGSIRIECLGHLVRSREHRCGRSHRRVGKVDKSFGAMRRAPRRPCHPRGAPGYDSETASRREYRRRRRPPLFHSGTEAPYPPTECAAPALRCA